MAKQRDTGGPTPARVRQRTDFSLEEEMATTVMYDAQGNLVHKGKDVDDTMVLTPEQWRAQRDAREAEEGGTTMGVATGELYQPPPEEDPNTP